MLENITTLNTNNQTNPDVSIAFMGNETEAISLSGEGSLADESRWVAYSGVTQKNGKLDKKPWNPLTAELASNTDPKTWGTKEQAERRANQLSKMGGSPGIGIVFGKLPSGDFISGLDLDGCRDPDTGELTQWALNLIERIKSYTEISPSNTGVKIFFLINGYDVAAIRTAMGKTKEGKAKHKTEWKVDTHLGIELHLDHSYFVATGQELGASRMHLEFIGPNDALQTISTVDLLWVIQEAGPAFLADSSSDLKSGTSNSVIPSRQPDQTNSGKLYALACRYRSCGRSREEFENAVLDDDAASAHLATLSEAGGQRAMDRVWNKAPNYRDPNIIFPDLTDKESRDLLGLDDIDPDVARVNEQHAVVTNGGQVRIAFFEDDGTFSLGKSADLHIKYANDLVLTPDGKRKEAVSQKWIRDIARRGYSSIVFKPNGSVPPDALNMWAGWGNKPDPDASCDLILAHIHNVMCGGNEEYAHYVLGWLAQMVQYPEEKPGTALVFKGGKGVGKDTLAVLMKKVVGRQHTAHIAKGERLTQQFNKHLEKAIFVHVEEANKVGGRVDQGLLQSIITADTLTIEPKGIDPYVVDSYARLFMTTNEDWAVPASADERRYAVFECSDTHRHVEVYFEPLYNEINGDGSSAFLHYLLSFDLTGFNVRKAPETAGLLQQKIASLKGFDLWLHDLLCDGTLPALLPDNEGWDKGPLLVERASLRSSYASFIRSRKFEGDPINATHFGRQLKKMLPELESKKVQLDGVRSPCYRVPALANCREAFNSHFGGNAFVDSDGE